MQFGDTLDLKVTWSNESDSIAQIYPFCGALVLEKSRDSLTFADNVFIVNYNFLLDTVTLLQPASDYSLMDKIPISSTFFFEGKNVFKIQYILRLSPKVSEWERFGVMEGIIESEDMELYVK